jgi:hypothetical protein
MSALERESDLAAAARNGNRNLCVCFDLPLGLPDLPFPYRVSKLSRLRTVPPGGHNEADVQIAFGKQILVMEGAWLGKHYGGWELRAIGAALRRRSEAVRRRCGP